MTGSPGWTRLKVYVPDDERLVWRREARTALLVTVFVTLLGSVVGLLWHALAPQLGIADAAQGSTAAMKALIGDDAWLALLGLIAGVVCVAVLILVAPRESNGPGAMLGLAVGGLLAMFVAARIGHQIGHRDLTDVLQTSFPGITKDQISLVLSYYDFSVRAKGVLLTWPFVSVLLNGVIIAIRSANEAPPPRASAYPGSS